MNELINILIDAMKTGEENARSIELVRIEDADTGDFYHVIRDTLAPAGQRVLFRAEESIEQGSLTNLAEPKLEELRSRRVALMVIAAFAAYHADNPDLSGIAALAK